ncbi:MAG TPA: type II toxin-antitoxin system RelE/ParE family toxin [Fontimonas sp.]
MTYELQFHADAWKEWRKLDESVKGPLKKKLGARLQEPRNPKAALRGMPDCYKLKHGSYRLVYRVIDATIVVLVMAVGKRDRLAAYDVASHRIGDDSSQ